MGKKKKSSQGSTTTKDNCLREAIVTDQFKLMMTEAFDKTKDVLNKRYDELTHWNDRLEEEFESIFGVSSDETITIKYYKPGQHLTEDARDTPSESKIKAHDFMKESVGRLIEICSRIDVGERMCDEASGFYIYGNFLNETALSVRAVARIAKGQTLNTLPESYKSTMRVEILQKFKSKKLTGIDSRVSILCHELSHLVIYHENNVYYGGMGSDDLLPEGRPKTSDEYFKHATNLMKNHSPEVFNNAYNIERYFEV